MIHLKTDNVAHDCIWQMMSRGISTHTWIKASVSSCTVCVGTWWLWMQPYMMSQRCWIGFRPGERAGHSISSMYSSSRQCWHTSATYHTHCHAQQGPDMISSWYLTAGRGALFFFLLAYRCVWGCPRTSLPTTSFTCQSTGHTGGCCRKYLDKPALKCKGSSWPGLQDARLRAQASVVDLGPSNHPCGVWFWQFGSVLNL